MSFAHLASAPDLIRGDSFLKLDITQWFSVK